MNFLHRAAKKETFVYSNILFRGTFQIDKSRLQDHFSQSQLIAVVLSSLTCVRERLMNRLTLFQRLNSAIGKHRFPSNTQHGSHLVRFEDIMKKGMM